MKFHGGWVRVEDLKFHGGWVRVEGSWNFMGDG
jgi:hypothetical protein